MATLRWRGAEGGDAAWRLWHRALVMDPYYLPAATQPGEPRARNRDAGLCSQVRREVDRRAATRAWSHLDGPTLPLGYGELAIDRSLALQSSVRAGTPDLFAQALAR